MSDCTSETGATAVTSAALIVGTTFPMARFSWPPAVPVTTTAFSSIGAWTRVRRTRALPTLTLRDNGR